MLNKSNDMYILHILNHIKEEIADIEARIKEEEIPVDAIFQDKKAIIGNYDSFHSNELRKILEGFGMNVEIFTTGTEILDKIKNGYKCDVIFTNNTYRNGIQGQELLSELKKLDGFHIPVIVHTIEKNQRFHFIDNIGFDEYIEKPIFTGNIEKIVEVKNILEKFLK